jgi:hypothetical protein
MYVALLTVFFGGAALLGFAAYELDLDVLVFYGWAVVLILVVAALVLVRRRLRLPRLAPRWRPMLLIITVVVLSVAGPALALSSVDLTRIHVMMERGVPTAAVVTAVHPTFGTAPDDDKAYSLSTMDGVALPGELTLAIVPLTVGDQVDVYVDPASVSPPLPIPLPDDENLRRVRLGGALLGAVLLALMTPLMPRPVVDGQPLMLRSSR